MTFENILCSVEAGIATVTVNRPDKLNALNAATLAELKLCFADLQKNDEVKVVVITGSGEKAFVAGADISELATMTAGQAQALAIGGQALFNELENLGKPVIAAINGFALGGGCELAMACTFRYAAASARLGLPETGLGLIPGFGGTQRLPRLVGRGIAMEMVLTGGMVSAEQAMHIGLVNQVFPDEELLPMVMKTAKALASKSSFTLGIAMKAVGQGLAMSQDSGMQFEAALFGVCGASADAHEGCAAFLEKRKPDFKGC